MQDSIKKVRKSLQDFVNFMKSKISKKPAIYVTFMDCFPCEMVALKLGYTFMPNDLNSPSKSSIVNGLMTQIMQVVWMTLLSISFVYSVKLDKFYVMIENVMFFGINFIMCFKIYTLYYKNIKRNRSNVAILDKHFPHSSDD